MYPSFTPYIRTGDDNVAIKAEVPGLHPYYDCPQSLYPGTDVDWRETNGGVDDVVGIRPDD